MNQNVIHFSNLISVAYADDELHENEVAFLRRVGKRLGLNEKKITELLKNPEKQSYNDLDGQIRRYTFLDDLLNLIMIDGHIHDNEISKCEDLAKELGFDAEMMDKMIDKIREHVQEGFSSNHLSEQIKFDIYNLTSNKEKYEKFN